MTTFAFRDARLPRLDEALAAVPADQPELRARLERERAALSPDDWTVGDRTQLAVAEDWLWDVRLELKAMLDADPVLVALGTASVVTGDEAAAIESIPHGPGGPPADYLDHVRAAVGDVAATFTALVHAAESRWLARGPDDRAYPFDDVAVMLPLRLETLFDPPSSPHNDDPDLWRMSLRVVPDEASVRRDDPHVSPGELSSVRAFWAGARAPGPVDPGWLDGDAAGVAWAALCRQVPPWRAAWLVAHLVPQVEDGELRIELPPGTPTAPQPNRVGGLPPRLSVWAVTLDEDDVQTRHLVGRLPMDQGTVISAETLPLPLPDRADTARDAWWASWTTAVQVGLAGEWHLEPGLTPSTLDALVVVGVGDEPPDDHFRAQSDAGELGLLRLGAPTNSVNGAAAADLATDAESWLAVAKARLGEALGVGSGAGPAGTAVELHLTGGTQLPAFPGADAWDDTQDSRRLARALWPALQGHWLTDLWGVGDDAFRLARWAFALDDEVPDPARVADLLHRPCEETAPRPADDNVCPEGPLMPLRIGDQPYGLLPVTSLSGWQPDAAGTPEADEQRRVEAATAAALDRLRGVWARAARRNGNVVGAPTDRFMELLSRHALSDGYVERAFLPAAAWAAPYRLDADGRSRFDDLVRTLYNAAADVVGTLPDPLYLTNGYWRPDDLPLVQPSMTLHRTRDQDNQGPVTLTRFLALLMDLGEPMDLAEVFSRYWTLDEGGEYRLRVLPDSLLIRLLAHACQLSSDWLRSRTGGDLGLRLLEAHVEAVRDVGCELDQPAWNGRERDPATGDTRFVISIPDRRRSQLERALRATLDSAAHRLDPWVTGFAWQRLRTHSPSRRHAHRLGAYGWVDGPFLGSPGPTEAGRLHTPSYDQTLAAVILRDRFLSAGRAASTASNGRNPWEMSISSSKARLAEEIADDVRLGFHIFEILGRHVENVVGSHQLVKHLRTSAPYAMHPDRLDPNEVCNGAAALTGLLAGDPLVPLEPGQVAALQALRDALDTYGDLLMADGVMQLVNRQPDRAAETMDAAAGFSRPPTFEFLRTPPSGYQVHTLVVGTVPYVAVDDVPVDAGPTRLADPSLAAFVDDTLGAGWTWTAVNRDDGSQLGTTSLQDLGLAPTDTLSLSTDFLCELVRRTMRLPTVSVTGAHAREWTVTDAAGAALGVVSLVDLGLTPDQLAARDPAVLEDEIRTRVGGAPDSVVAERLPADPRMWVATDEYGGLLGLATTTTLGVTGEQVDALDEPAVHRLVRQSLGLADATVRAPVQHDQAQQLAAAFGNRPAAGRDLAHDESQQHALDVGIYAELRGRYLALHDAGRTLVEGLRAADDAGRPALLRRAVAWGVTPVSEPRQREALFAALSGAPPPASATSPAELAEAMATALAGRLDAAPQPADLAPAPDLAAPLPDHEQRKREQLPDGVPTLAEAIANLASPQGRLSVLACWDRATLLDTTRLEVGHSEEGLDEEWLTVLAAVRPALARLEALQLALAAPLAAWSSSPGDPFLTGDDQVVRRNLRTRSERSALQMTLDERFVAAYGRQAAWTGDRVAVGLVDSYAEAVPMPQRATSAAIGFNAPAARAPQAILLAVPPRTRQRLEEELVLQIVTETRESAHARTAHVEDLGDLQALTPTIWLQSSGPAQVRLEPYPLFT